MPSLTIMFVSDASYTNIQVLSSDSAAVRLAIDVCDIGSAKMLARADSKWTSVYPILAEDDYAYLKIIAAKLSNRLQTTAIGFYVPESNILRYAIYRNDEVIDEYCSNPGFPSHQKRPQGGDVDLILPFCVDGTKARDLRKLLHPKQLPANEDEARLAGDRIAQRLAQLLGIPRADLCTGFNHLKWAQAGR